MTHRIHAGLRGHSINALSSRALDRPKVVHGLLTCRCKELSVNTSKEDEFRGGEKTWAGRSPGPCLTPDLLDEVREEGGELHDGCGVV